MNKQKKLKLFYILYLLLIFLTISICVKFVVDFCLMSKDIKISPDNTKKDFNKFIVKPAFQTYKDGFEYIEADKGYLNQGEYIFENVDSYGDLGIVKSGKVKIKDNKNNIEFTENPSFVIYLDNINDKN